MGAQILGVKNTDVDNDALITLVDMLGNSPGFDEIITLALRLHRDNQIMLLADVLYNFLVHCAACRFDSL